MFNHFLLHDSADVRSCTKVFQHCIKGRMKKNKQKGQNLYIYNKCITITTYTLCTY